MSKSVHYSFSLPYGSVELKKNVISAYKLQKEIRNRVGSVSFKGRNQAFAAIQRERKCLSLKRNHVVEGYIADVSEIHITTQEKFQISIYNNFYTYISMCFEVLKALNTKMAAFWVVEPRNLV